MKNFRLAVAAVSVLGISLVGAPAARAGTLRLYDEAAVAQVRHELNGIDARRAGKAVVHAE